MKHIVAFVALILLIAGCSGNSGPTAPSADTGADVATGEDVSASDATVTDAGDSGDEPDITANVDSGNEPDGEGSLEDADIGEAVLDGSAPSDDDAAAGDTSDVEAGDAEADIGEDTGVEPPDRTCSQHSDCGRCAFPTAPRTLDDCYCIGCATEVLSVGACESNQQAWEAVCGAGQWPGSETCPQVRCVLPKPTACMDATCIDACERADCPVLSCPNTEWMTLPGDCCPRCAGENTCFSNDDCTLCSYRGIPSSSDECQCPWCPTEAMTPGACDVRAEAFVTHCGDEFLATCPIPVCLPQPPAVCGRGGHCERQPFLCTNDEDCGYCPFSRAPTNPSECECAGCGTPMPTAECEAIQQKVAQVCDGFDFDACLPPPCPAPPGLVCEFWTRSCVMSL
jgi:hypothetical protein